MGKPIDAREVEYAYEDQSTVQPNVPVDGGYAVQFSVLYELKDINGDQLMFKNVNHYSPASETMRTATQVTAWVADNRDALIAADKFNLSGYGA